MVAFGCSVALLGACFGATSTWFQEALRGLVTGLDAKSLVPLLMEHGILAAGMAAVVIRPRSLATRRLPRCYRWSYPNTRPPGAGL